MGARPGRASSGTIRKASSRPSGSRIGIGVRVAQGRTGRVTRAFWRGPAGPTRNGVFRGAGRVPATDPASHLSSSRTCNLSEEVPLRFRRLVAFHEAGRAVVAWDAGLHLPRVSIYPEEHTRGRILVGQEFPVGRFRRRPQRAARLPPPPRGGPARRHHGRGKLPRRSARRHRDRHPSDRRLRAPCRPRDRRRLPRDGREARLPLGSRWRSSSTRS